MKRVLLASTALVSVPLFWMPIASSLWANMTGTTFSPFGWWDATQWWQANWWCDICLVGSAAIPTVFVGFLGMMAFQFSRLRYRNQMQMSGAAGVRRRSAPKVERGVTDNHGHSQWRSISDAQKLFRGPHPQHGGIVVGEAYRVDEDKSIEGLPFDPDNRKTWGIGGKAPLLIDPCNRGSGHSIVFAGPGGYKTTSAVSSILTWRGSSIVLDPSTELGPMLDMALRRQRKNVAHIGVPSDDPSRPPLTGFNVLGWIDPAHPEAELHVRSVVSWIYEEKEASTSIPGKHEDPFFAPMGRNLVTCLLAHMIWADPTKVEISLRTFAKSIARPEKEMLDLLGVISRSSKSEMAKRLALVLMACKAEETFSGVFLNAIKGVEWLFTGAYADIVSAGDFDPLSLLLGRTTVFLNIPLRTLETTPAIARVLVGALLNTLYMADGRMLGRVLILLDEAARLGRMKTLETARDIGRKYGVSLHMLFQSIGQMAEAWGRDGTRAWIDAANWIGYAAIRAGGAGKDLSEQLGAFGVLARSEGDNRGRQMPFGFKFGSLSRGTNINIHEVRRPLMTAAEMQQDLRDDEIIIVPAQGLPIRCGRAIYFRRPEMVAQVAASRFAVVGAEKAG